jgi:hypothetical protein
MTDSKDRGVATSPVGGIDEIMKRAADGKVAVVERGGEPKIIGKPEESEAKGNGADKDNGTAEAKEAETELPKNEAAAEEAPKAPEAPQPVPLDADDAEQIRESLQAMRELEAQLASARIQYRQTEDDLIEKRKTAQTELNATVKSIAKRNKVADGWMVNLDLMQFEPPRRQPFPFARR